LRPFPAHGCIGDGDPAFVATICGLPVPFVWLTKPSTKKAFAAAVARFSSAT
jgi:hypothetical protein